MIRSVLGSRASIGGVLGSGRGGAAAAWYLAGGVSAANCIAAYTPKGAASLAASYDNNAAPGNGLADGTYDAAPGVAPTFDTATGWSFANSEYLTTGITPGSGWSAAVRFSNASTDNAYLFGAKGSKFWGILPRYNASSVLYLVGASTATGQQKTPVLNGGVVTVAGAAAYRNGSDEGLTLIQDSSPAPFFLGASNNGSGTAENKFTGKIQAIAIYNVTLDAATVAAISAAMAAL